MRLTRYECSMEFTVGTLLTDHEALVWHALNRACSSSLARFEPSAQCLLDMSLVERETLAWYALRRVRGAHLARFGQRVKCSIGTLWAAGWVAALVI